MVACGQHGRHDVVSTEYHVGGVQFRRFGLKRYKGYAQRVDVDLAPLSILVGPNNVMLLEPLDPVVFDRTVERDGLRCVAPSQLAVDLLTGPGREPSQGEQMLEWMQRNEHVWRS